MKSLGKTFFVGLLSGVFLCVLAYAGVQWKGSNAEAVNSKTGYETKPVGELAIGPDNAPITLVEYADFHCPFCTKATRTVQELLKEYPGQIKWVFKHYPLRATPGSGSFLTHQASMCAYEQGKFWEYHDAFFEDSPPPRHDSLIGLADYVGLERNQFVACLDGDAYNQAIMNDRREGQKRGVSGTPKFYINEYEVSGAYPLSHFKQIAEAILRPGEVEPPLEALPKQPPGPIKFDDLESRPAMGNPDAPIKLVEFSDYHCPFCRRLGPTLQKIVDTYGDRVYRVFRHFPLKMHPKADLVHIAAECAFQQDQFWGFHNQVFETPQSQHDRAGLVGFAQSMGLDVALFETCLDGDVARKAMENDKRIGYQSGVEGTPAVFVNGTLLPGAQPFATFQALIEDELKNN